MRRPLRFVVWLGTSVVAFGAIALAAPSAPSWVDDLSPISSADWNHERAAHLLERAGFGGTPEDIDRLASMTPQQAVASLVEYARVDDTGAAAFEESGV